MKRWLMLLPGLGLLAPAALAAPAEWPAPRYDQAGNPPTAAGFELGRRLFYDPLLSRDGTVSCASCHQQASAFAHTAHRLSHGVGGQLGTRNTPALFNLAWQPDFMRDGAATHLEMQPLLPLVNAVEMAETPAHVIEKLRAAPGYPAAFERAFGSPGIDTQRLLRALGQFTSALVSKDSRYDRMLAGRTAFDAGETQGLSVFRAQCASCHAEPLFSDFSYRSNGLDAQPADPGRMAVSGRAADRGLFRVPSLRNVAVSAPYMHDGRFTRLDEVIGHYADHLVRESASEPLRSQPVLLDPSDREALLAFLHTLTDETFLHDPRYAEPPPPAPSWSSQFTTLFDRGLAMRAGAGEAPVAAAARPAQLSLSTPQVEVVVTQRARELLIYVDEHASNRPVEGLDAQLLSAGRVLGAERRGAGVYAVSTAALDLTRAQAMSVRIRGPDLDLRLQGELSPVAAVPLRPSRPWLATLILVVTGLGIVAVALRVLLRWRR